MWGGRNKRDSIPRGFATYTVKDKSKYTATDWASEVCNEIRGCDSILPVGHSIYDVFSRFSGVTETIIELEIYVSVDYGTSYKADSVRNAVNIAINNVHCPYRVNYTIEKM